MSHNGPRGLIFLGDVKASNQATVTLNQTGSTAYTTFYVAMSNVSMGNSGAILQMKLGAIVTNYQSGIDRFAYNSNAPTDTSSGTIVLLSTGIVSSTYYSGYFYITNFASVPYTSLWGAATWTDSTSTVSTFGLLVASNTANAIGTLNFSASAGNIATGTFSIFGVLE